MSKPKFGRAFEHELVVERKSQHRQYDKNPIWWLGSGRFLFYCVITGLAIFTLAIRLFDLTIINGRKFRQMSNENRIRELTIHAPRGIIYDRTGQPLVKNIMEFRYIKPCPIDKTNSTESCTSFIEPAKAAEITANGLSPGEYLERDYFRQYLSKSAVSHIVGYIGEIRQEELSDEYYSLRKYKIGDWIGRFGTEAVFESTLRGRNGRELVEVDSNGNNIRILGTDAEKSGSDIHLSIDLRLSETAQKVFPKDKKGAIVVSKPDTGEILVLYSSPTFDPNIFFRGSEKDVNIVINNSDRPLFNRVLSGTYPPGSTFKIIPAVAALEEKVITGQTVIEDTGVIKAGTSTFANWYFTQYGKTEGAVNIVKAIKRSNDIFFYKIGEMVGIEKLTSWAHKLGLGNALGIELPGEAAGLVPDPKWKKEQFTTPDDKRLRNDLWYDGDTYNTSIGQGYLQTTPLQVNFWTNVIANGGYLCKPTIRQNKSHDKSDCRNLKISSNTIDLIEKGMIGACQTGGTGWPLFNFKIANPKKDQNPYIYIPIACKTGTAETGISIEKTHAWFTAYAPANQEIDKRQMLEIPVNAQVISGKPEISVTVLIEEGGEGSSIAAPIAKAIFEDWFNR